MISFAVSIVPGLTWRRSLIDRLDPRSRDAPRQPICAAQTHWWRRYHVTRGILPPTRRPDRLVPLRFATRLFPQQIQRPILPRLDLQHRRGRSIEVTRRER